MICSILTFIDEMRRVYRNSCRILIPVFVVIVIIELKFGVIHFKRDEKQYPTTSQSRTPIFHPFSGFSELSDNRNSTIRQSRASIFHWTPFGWEQWNGFCSDNVLFDKAVLKTPTGLIPIFIHNVLHDAWVSYYIKKKGAWEKDLLMLVHHFLSADENLHLIDIGSHIGEFSLMGAKMGRQVISVDPLYENVRRLCKSIEVNNFSHLIKVFYTALSDSRTKVSFIRHSDNIGGTRIKKMNMEGITYNTTNHRGVKIVSPPSLSLSDKNTIDTVLLDDLLPFTSIKKAFMKIDVETHENCVLKGGERFFRSIDIRYVLVEWVTHHKNSNSGRQIIKFLSEQGYTPSMPTFKKEIFKENEMNTNILWIKT